MSDFLKYIFYFFVAIKIFLSEIVFEGVVKIREIIEIDIRESVFLKSFFKYKPGLLLGYIRVSGTRLGDKRLYTKGKKQHL